MLEKKYGEVKQFKVAMVTISPTVRPANAKVLPLAPFMLKSYSAKRLNEEGHNVSFRIFSFKENTPTETIVKEVSEESFDLIVFVAYIWNLKELLSCSKILQIKKPDTLFVMGGPQVSPLALDIMKFNTFLDAVPYIDFNGELLFYNLLKTLLDGKSLSQAPGLVIKDSKLGFIRTKPLTEKIELKDLPSPYLDGSIVLDPEEKYFITLETSRGCPFNCAYCHWGKGSRRVDFFPLDRVIKEVEFVFSKPNVIGVYFADSNFLFNPKQALTIMKLIKKLIGNREPPRMNFEIDVNSFTESAKEAVIELAKLPDFKFTFAVQTINPRALAHIDGHFKFNRRGDFYTEKLKILHSWYPDAEIYADVMLPLPGDDLKGFRETINFCLELKASNVMVNYPVYLLPGSTFYDERDNLDITYTKPYDNSVIVETQTFPKNDVAKAYKLLIWTEIITVYYPVIRDVLYHIKDNNPGVACVDIIERWMDALEIQNPILSPCVNLIDVAIKSVTSRNLIKGAILRKLCETKSAHILYSVVAEDFATNFKGSNIPKEIDQGKKFFSYLHKDNVDCLDTKEVKKYLSNSTDTIDGIKLDELNQFLPTFTRVPDMVGGQDLAYQQATQNNDSVDNIEQDKEIGKRKSNQSMLDYYKESKLNPDLFLVEKEEVWKSHYAKRFNLYQNHLQIPFSLLNNSSVLEFGCCSGENSLVLASAGANLTLVEPNENMHDRLKKLFKNFGFEKQMVLEAKKIDEFKSNELYDLAIAEGFLYSLPNRDEMLQKISGFLKPNGLGIISFMDKYGSLLEFTKKLILTRICELSKNDVESEASLEFATKLFKQDFDKLNVSRDFGVWWQELMCGPSEKYSCLWSYPELMSTLEKSNCEFYSCSPKWDVSNNFLWYKDIPEKNIKHKKILDNWKQNFVFFLTGLQPNNQEKPALSKTIDSVSKLVEDISNYAEGKEGFSISSVNYPKELNDYLSKSSDSRIIDFNLELKKLYDILKSSDLDEIIFTYLNSKHIRDLWGSFYHYICFRKLASL